MSWGDNKEESEQRRNSRLSLASSPPIHPTTTATATTTMGEMKRDGIWHGRGAAPHGRQNEDVRRRIQWD